MWVWIETELGCWLLLRIVAYRRILRGSIAGTSTSELSLVEESTTASWRSPLDGPVTDRNTRESSVREAIGERSRSCVVALGKFDAMHLGHRSLVEKASRMGGQPWLISFSGMASELGESRKCRG